MELWKYLQRLEDAVYKYNLYFSDEETKVLLSKIELAIYDKIFNKQLL